MYKRGGGKNLVKTRSCIFPSLFLPIGWLIPLQDECIFIYRLIPCTILDINAHISSKYRGLKLFFYSIYLYHNYFIKWSGLIFLKKEIYAVQKYQGKQVYQTQKIIECYTVKLEKWHAPSIPFQKKSLNILRQLSGMALPFLVKFQPF